MKMRDVFAVMVCLLAVGRAQEAGRVVSAKEARHRAEVGVVALQRWYEPGTGLYRTTGWWNSANGLTAVIDLMRASGSKKYVGVVGNTFVRAQIAVAKTEQVEKRTGFPGFLNHYYDDEGWWALAWIDGYDLTRDGRYLGMAETIFADMAGGWDSTCGGGIWWSKDRTYKNAIANELFFSVAAHLAVRGKGDRQSYSDWAGKEWAWFQASGMVNERGLVNDGLVIDADSGACRNNGKTVWTYNQGVLLGGLAEWSLGHGTALPEARGFADAALKALTDTDGVLHDGCEPECGADGVQFKGIFARNLGVLNRVVREPRYSRFLAVNAESIWAKDQAAAGEFGVVWSGTPTMLNAGAQISAVDALVAAMPGKR